MLCYVLTTVCRSVETHICRKYPETDEEVVNLFEADMKADWHVPDIGPVGLHVITHLDKQVLQEDWEKRQKCWEKEQQEEQMLKRMK